MESEKICHACLHLEDEKSSLLKLLPPSEEMDSKSARRLYEVLYETLETNEESQLDQLCKKCSVTVREMYSFISNCEKSKFILKGLRRVCTELKNDTVMPFAKPITVKPEKPDSEDTNADSSNHIVENNMDVVSSSPIIENEMDAVSSNPMVENDMDAVSSNPVVGNDIDAVSLNPTVENDVDAVSSNRIAENDIDAVSSNPIAENDIDAVSNPMVEKDIDAVSSNPMDEKDNDAVSSDPMDENDTGAVSSNPMDKNDIDAVSTNSMVESDINAVSNPTAENPTEADIKQVIKIEKEDSAEISGIMVKEELVDFEEYDTRLEVYQPSNDFGMQSTDLDFGGVQVKLERNEDSAQTAIENQSVQDEIETNDDSEFVVFEINEEKVEFDTEMASNESDANNKNKLENFIPVEIKQEKDTEDYQKQVEETWTRSKPTTSTAMTSTNATQSKSKNVDLRKVNVKAIRDLYNKLKRPNTRREINEFSCDYCEFTFRSKGQYTTHVAMHMDYSFKCDVCDSAFQHANSLAAHKRSHVTQKQLPKRNCTKKTKPKAGRREAVRYKCKYCEFSFIMENQYNTHLALHMAHTFECDECGMAFQNQDSLTAHKQQRHNITAINRLTSSSTVATSSKAKSYKR